MLAELLETEVMSVPQFDGGQAIATALAMACRITNRQRVLLPELMNPTHRVIVENYMDSVQDELKVNVEYINVEYIKADPKTGKMDLQDLRAKINNNVAAVLLENPGFLGVVDDQGPKISKIVKASGAEFVVYVNPISLGVLEAPSNYGATITCGDLHSLGLHLAAGNGQAGFISTSSDAKYLNNYKDFIYGFAEPEVEGEYVFGNMLIERTHYAKRAFGNEYTGTGTNLWMISAAVYLALMGPKGMAEVGETILYNSQYAAQEIAKLPNVRLHFSGFFFQEFVVDFSKTGKSVDEINQALLEHDIFGGLDLAEGYPHLEGCALYCVTEIMTKEDIDQLVSALATVLA